MNFLDRLVAQAYPLPDANRKEYGKTRVMRKRNTVSACVNVRTRRASGGGKLLPQPYPAFGHMRMVLTETEAIYTTPHAYITRFHLLRVCFSCDITISVGSC